MSGGLWMDLPGSVDLPLNALYPNGSSWIYQDGAGYVEMGVEGCADTVEHGGYTFYAQRGNRAAQTTLLVGDNIGTFYYLSKDTAGTEGLRAAIRTIVDAPPTVGNVPTAFSFTSGGADGGVERLRIRSSGVSYFSGTVEMPLLVVQPTTGNANILLNPQTDAQASINFYNATNLKWQLGNQVGTSSFFLYSIPANKVALDIDNATALITLVGPPTANLHAATKKYVDDKVAAVPAPDLSSRVKIAGDTMSGNLVVDNANAAIQIKTTNATQSPQLFFTQGALNRFANYVAPTTGDFALARYNDAGAFVDNPFSVGRSDGRIYLTQDPNTPLGVATKQYVDAGVQAINATNTTAYTFVLSDTGKLVLLNNSSNSAMNATVPPNSAVAFPIGARIDLAVQMPNVATVVPGAGVTIWSEDSKRRLPKQSSCATLTKISTDAWMLCGSLMA
jgi:hypothetical protein